MGSTYLINEGKKKKLRQNAINGASQYAHYLMDKVFFVICEDGTEYELRFLKSDFRHLTGIDSNLDDDTFFYNCKYRILDTGNINSYQSYNWQTLNSKSKRIANIHRILYDNIQGALFMINLHTNTRKFPVAIKNTNIDTCIGFVDNNNKARTLRKYSSSNNADEQKKIYLIIAKKQNESTFDELVYVSQVDNVYSMNKNILDKMSEKLQNKFLEILTKPQK